MNIYERLIEDHERQRELCKQLAETSGDTPERREAWRKLEAELEAHANAEEQAFYAVMLGRPDGQEKARHSIAEHKQMSDLIADLNAKTLDDTGWLTVFKQLKHDVLHHLDEEEDEIFACAKEVISDERAKELVAAFEERKLAELEQV